MVLKSILEQSSPNGLVRRYIRQTQIAAIIPNTGILAVHGGLTQENMGRLPTMKSGDPIITNVHSWIQQFNDWYRVEVMKWAGLKHDTLPLELKPARSTLDTFSLRVASEYRSIVTASMLDEHRQFTRNTKLVSNYLQQSNINLVLTGHQPCGDHLVLLRSKDDRVVFINGDISYADAKSRNVHDTRGLASHTLQILVNDKCSKINIDAYLATGKRVQNSLDLVEGTVVDDTHIGKVLPGNELVQCILGETGYYRTIHQKGFIVEYKFRTKSEIDLLLKSDSKSSAVDHSGGLVF